MNSMETIRQLSDDELRQAYIAVGSIQGIGRLLNISVKAPCVRRLINDRLRDSDVLKEHTKRSAYTIEDIKRAVESSICMSEVLRTLGLSTHGACATVIKKLCLRHDISIAHFDPWSATKRGSVKRWQEAEIFVEHSPVPRSTLHKHVKRFGVLGEPRCGECGIATQYNNKPISLTVDHVNGVSNDNRIENLRWLCPNCHSQTDTYCGKNI